MARDDSLKRLGGGSWQTRDGRFTIESGGGRWSVIDAERTDELGLPLVRGPFGSLTEAKEAIEQARDEPARLSPLAERLAASKASHRSAGDGTDEPPAKARRSRQRDEAAAAPAPPPAPRWLVELDGASRTRAERLIAALRELGMAEPETIVREDVTSDRPAVARAVLVRRLALVAAEAAGADADEAERDRVARIVGLVAEWLSNRGREPGPRLALPGWRLVEEEPEGRRIELSQSDVEREVGRVARD